MRATHKVIMTYSVRQQTQGTSSIHDDNDHDDAMMPGRDELMQ